jgi:hypothetical protein
MWTTGIPQANESNLTLNKNSIQKQLLINNNVGFVAESVANSVIFHYGQVKLEDGSLFLIEIKIAGGQLHVKTKTFSMHLIQLFQESISELLNVQ